MQYNERPECAIAMSPTVHVIFEEALKITQVQHL